MTDDERLTIIRGALRTVHSTIRKHLRDLDRSGVDQSQFEIDQLIAACQILDLMDRPKGKAQ